MDTTSNKGIDVLIEIINNRISQIANRSLKRFQDLYNELPGFQNYPLPFLAEDIERAEHAPEKLNKIVFLLGAGTSKSAGIPLAKEIIGYCETALEKKLLKKEVETIREELEKKGIRLYEDISTDKAGYTFEEVMAAYMRLLGEEEVIQLMRHHFLVHESEFPKKTMITLFNECLAHLARENLLDFIVTFNFDELLELSLDEDIGPQSYVKLISPARFKWAVIHGLIESKDSAYTHPHQRDAEWGCEQAKVWLLKPHGTISHENTMRHLIDHVWQFEKEKEAVLKKVFKNSYLVVVGYSLAAADLHRILLTHALTGSIKGLFWIDPCQKCAGLGENLKNVIEEIKPGSFYHIRMNADSFAQCLFEKLYSEGTIEKKKTYGLLPPYRHFLRAFVFQKDHIPSTFENRFIVELINYGIRLKGWFSSRTIFKSHQVKHLLENATQRQKDKTLTNLPQKIEPFFQGLLRKGRTEQVFILRKKFACSNVLGKVISHCIPHSMKHIQKNHKTFPNQIWAETAEKMGMQLIESIDVSPYTYYDDIGTFNDMVMIPNKPVLDSLTSWLLSQENNLYIISEVGNWISVQLEQNTNKFSYIALGDYPSEKKGLMDQINRLHIADDLFMDDIIRSTSISETIKNYLGKNCSLIPLFQKNIHFTLWHDVAQEKVLGIIFNRLDRQAGTTFYWIKLDITDNEIENDQFKALKRYMGMDTPG